MRAGRIEQLGTPTDVFHAPRSRFVAGFMGDASFLPVRGDGGRLVTELGELTDGPSGPAGPAVAVARPDDVTFEPAADGAAEIVGAEFRGPTWTYTLRLPSGTVVRSSRSHLVRLPVGATAHVSLVPGHRLVAVADDEALMTSVDVLVVGGGPCGLAAALGAARRGRSVRLLEASDHLGGMAASFEVAGQRVDHGSHRLHPSAPPPVRALLDELLGADLQERRRNGRLHLAGRWVGFPLRATRPRAVGAGRDRRPHRHRPRDGTAAPRPRRLLRRVRAGRARPDRAGHVPRTDGGQAVGPRPGPAVRRAGPPADRRQRRRTPRAPHRPRVAAVRPDVPLSPPRVRRGRRPPGRRRRGRRRRDRPVDRRRRS